MTSSFVACGRGLQRLVRGIQLLREIVAPRRTTPSTIRLCTHGRTTSPAPCSMMAKHQCFGLGSGLEVKRASTPEKPWLTSSLPLPSTAFSWQTQNGAKQPRAMAQTTSKLALGTGRRPGGMRPQKNWPKPWLSTRSQNSSLPFTKPCRARGPCTTQSCTRQSCLVWDLKCGRTPPGTPNSRCSPSE